MNSVSVVVVAYNESARIQGCITAILANDFPEFEVVVVDDASDDDTASIAAACDDMRVKVLRNEVRLGPAASRNFGISACRGDYIFFLDADCTVGSDWIRMGAEPMEDNESIIAVEGAMFYERARPSIFDKVPVNPFYNLELRGSLTAPRCDFGSGNLAIRRSALLTVGGFNARRYPNGREDTDLGRRLMRLGEFAYAPAMKAIHRAETWRLGSLLRNARRYAADVVFCKDHGVFHFRSGVFLHPRFLAMLLFPPLIPLRFRLDSTRAWRFLAAFYIYLLALRLVIWRTALRERIFLL